MNKHEKDLLKIKDRILKKFEANFKAIEKLKKLSDMHYKEIQKIKGGL